MRLAAQEGKPEIFYTLQGEGVSIGRPATFMRLSGCNLTCKWCDTPYTWNWDDKDYEHPEKYDRASQMVTLTNGEIAKLLKRLPDSALSRLVITGGEPMLQQTQIWALWHEIVYEQKLPFRHLEIETNGTVQIRGRYPEHVRFNVSPKLSNSGIEYDKRINENLLDYKARASCFKFVVDTEDDMAEVNQIVEEFRLNKERIFLMPQGRTEEEITEKLGWLSDICMTLGYNLTPRLHVLTWGAKRGV